MNIHISLRPYTDFRPKDLGAQLMAIVKEPVNRRLFVDFPRLRDVYSDINTAKATVRQCQADMRDDPTYKAMAVMLGTSAATAQVWGATSLYLLPIPERGQGPGIHTAAWLAPNRPDVLKGVGRQLLELRIRWLINLPAFYGPLWTLIRPGNLGSRPVWTRQDLSLKFEILGGPKAYPQLDGQVTPRELFASTRPIETLRGKGSGRRNTF